MNPQSCLIWSVQTSPTVEQCHWQQQLYLRSDSGQPNPPGPNLQSTDSVQTTWHRQDWIDLTYTCSLMGTGATYVLLGKEEAGRTYRKARRPGVVRGSAHCLCGRVGELVCNDYCSLLVQCLTLRGKPKVLLVTI